MTMIKRACLQKNKLKLKLVKIRIRLGHIRVGVSGLAIIFASIVRAFIRENGRLFKSGHRGHLLLVYLSLLSAASAT